MHLMAKSVDSGQLQDLKEAGAMVRSAYHDLKRLRKEVMAGRQRGKLDPRPDEDQERLLSREEEEKIGKARWQVQRQRPRFERAQPASSSHNVQPQGIWNRGARSRSRGKGKGKGKQE